jgi:hypothetical protein
MSQASTPLLPAPDESPVQVTELEAAIQQAITAYEPASRRQVLREALRRQLTAHRDATVITETQAIRVARAVVHQAADPCLSAMRGDVPEGQHERDEPRCPGCRVWRSAARELQALMVTALEELDSGKQLTPPPDEPAPGSWTQRCAAPDCGRAYQTTKANSKTCSDRCRTALSRARERRAVTAQGPS